MSEGRRVWVDVETTGLDPNRGHLLEVAVVVTTASPAYAELAAQSWVVGWAFPLGKLSEYFGAPALAMHQANGLLDQVLRDDAESQAEVQDRVCAFIDQHAGAEYRGPMGGQSVHFDQAWLARHMPEVRKRFNHRVFDVSTLTQFWKDAGRIVPAPTAAAAVHRALPDIRWSIEVARQLAAKLDYIP